jgi:hypothetical protein
MTEDGMKLNFTPSAPGEHTFEMRVLDSTGNESTNAVVNITVVPNHPPVILPYNTSLNTGEDEDLVIDVSQWVEDDDEELRFSLNSSDPGMEVNPLGYGSFQIVPEKDLNDILDLSFNVKDDFNNTIVLDAFLVIEPVPDAPEFIELNGNEVLIGTQEISGYEDTVIIFNFTIRDPDLEWEGDLITLTCDSEDVEINGTLASFTPAENVVDEFIFNFMAEDSYGLSDNVSVILDVINVNDEPVMVITGMVETVEVGEDISINFAKCSDPDGDTLTYHVKIDGGNWIETQTFHVLNFDTAGNHTVYLKVDDGNGGVKNISYTLEVTNPAIDDDDDIIDDDTDDDNDDEDDTSPEAFSADPIMVVLLAVIAVLAVIFLTLLFLTITGRGRKKDPWEDFDDEVWEE